MSSKQYATAEYKRNRAVILADGTDTICALCGKAGANTADHIIPIMHGGDNSIENLRPAHQRCNSRKGASDQAKEQAKKRADRNAGVTKSDRGRAIPPPPNENTASDFFINNTLTPAPVNPIFFAENQPELVGIDADNSGLIEIGRELPRLESTGVGVLSLGDEVAEFSRRYLQMELMPWQKHCLHNQLLMDSDGDFVHRESLVSTARQNGKSLALSALVGAFLIHNWGRPVNVLSTANMLDRAEAIHATVAPILVEYFGAKQMQALGRKSVTMPNGSKWEVRAASTRLHGGSYDLVVADEIFDIAPEVMDTAIRPTMIARRAPLLSCWSTAGDADSLFMQQMREQGLKDIDDGVNSGLYFAEWSIPAGADPKDERFWRWANPALGTTITLKALKAAAKKDYFLRAHLNQWITARGGWLDHGVWDTCISKQPFPIGVDSVLSVDSSVNESRYVGVRAAMNGLQTMAQVEFVVDSEEQMWVEVNRIMEDSRCLLAITPTYEIHVPTHLQRRYTVVGYAELLRYTSLVLKMILEGKVQAQHSTALNEHMNRAVMVKTAQGAVLSSQKSAGPIELARCLVFAVSLISKPTNKQKPMLVVSQ